MKSQLPDLNGSPALYEGAALPDELSWQLGTRISKNESAVKWVFVAGVCNYCLPPLQYRNSTSLRVLHFNAAPILSSPCGFIHTNNAIHWASFTADGCYIVRTMELRFVHTRFTYCKILQKTMFCERLPVQYFKLSSLQEYPYSRECGYSCCRRQHIPILQAQFSAACLTPFI